MPPLEHSAILMTFIRLPFVIKYQVACDERAFRIFERLIENPIAEQMFLDCVSTVKRGTKTCVKLLLSKRLKIGFQDQLSLNAGRERGGSAVECLTGDRGAMGLSLTGVAVLWSLSKTHLS